MSKRIVNFSAGPAAMPEAVLEEAKHQLVNYKESGMSIMEMSHRSKPFEAVLERARFGIETLLNVPDTHQILFLQGF